jgi:hypothetical protein
VADDHHDIGQGDPTRGSRRPSRATTGTVRRALVLAIALATLASCGGKPTPTRAVGATPSSTSAGSGIPSAPASLPAGAEAGPQACGKITNKGVTLSVRITRGQVTCAEAVRVMNAYRNLDASQIDDSGAHVRVEGFSCGTTPGAEWKDTGHASDCTSSRGAISLDGPYQEVRADPNSSGGSTAHVSAAALDSATLSTDGLGPVRIGMTVTQISALAGHSFTPSYPNGPSCGTANPFGSSESTPMLLFDHDELVRISIFTGSAHTPSGIRIGSSESAVRSAFAGHLRQEPNTYEPAGHYFTYLPTDGSGRSLRVATDGARVTEMHAGQAQAVTYVEGCE